MIDTTNKNRMFVVRISLLLMICFLLSSQQMHAKTTFSDVPSWAKDGVEWMVDHNITLGYTDGTYRPHQKLTEKEFILMLSRAVKTSAYSRVIQNMGNKTWSEKVAQVVKDYKIGGAQESQASSDVIRFLNLPLDLDLSQQITRGKVAQIFTKALTGKYVTEQDAVQFLIKNRYTTAKDFRSFYPSQPLLRSEISAFLQRIAEYPIKYNGSDLKIITYKPIQLKNITSQSITEDKFGAQYIAQKEYLETNILPKYQTLQEKYPVYTLTGKIISTNPFQIWGVAVTDVKSAKVNLPNSTNIIVKNPDENLVFYGSYVQGKHYYQGQSVGKDGLGNEVTMVVFDSTPKELENYQKTVNSEKKKLEAYKKSWLTEIKKNNKILTKSAKDADYLHAALRLAIASHFAGEEVQLTTFFKELPRNELIANFILNYGDLVDKANRTFYYNEAIKYDKAVAENYVK